MVVPASNVPRGRERGTAIFVVVLVVTLLTGVGLFAARVTGAVDSAAGYARQAAQAKALAVYAAQLAPGVLAADKESILIQMDLTKSASTATQCPTNRYAAMECAVRNHPDLLRITTASVGSTNPLLAAQSQTTSGSLGPGTGIAPVSGVSTGLEGNLRAEYFEKVRAPTPAGEDKGSNGQSPRIPFEFAITASAQIRPIIDSNSQDWCTSDSETSNANVQAIRMYVTVP